MNELQYSGAFVIQFRTGRDFKAGRIAGRIEHIASGRSGQFATAAGMLELFARLFDEAQSRESTTPSLSIEAGTSSAAAPVLPVAAERDSARSKDDNGQITQSEVRQ